VAAEEEDAEAEAEAEEEAGKKAGEVVLHKVQTPPGTSGAALLLSLTSVDATVLAVALVPTPRHNSSPQPLVITPRRGPRHTR
jgi:hypothetical protein